MKTSPSLRARQWKRVVAISGLSGYLLDVAERGGLEAVNEVLRAHRVARPREPGSGGSRGGCASSRATSYMLNLAELGDLAVSELLRAEGIGVPIALDHNLALTSCIRQASVSCIIT